MSLECQLVWKFHRQSVKCYFNGFLVNCSLLDSTVDHTTLCKKNNKKNEKSFYMQWIKLKHGLILPNLFVLFFVQLEDGDVQSSWSGG